MDNTTEEAPTAPTAAVVEAADALMAALRSVAGVKYTDIPHKPAPDAPTAATTEWKGVMDMDNLRAVASLRYTTFNEHHSTSAVNTDSKSTTHARANLKACFVLHEKAGADLQEARRAHKFASDALIHAKGAVYDSVMADYDAIAIKNGLNTFDLGVATDEATALIDAERPVPNAD